MVEANPQDPKKDPRVSEEKRVADEKKHAADTRAARRKRRRILSVIGIIFCVLALLYLIYWLIWARFEEYTDDAYVNGNLVRLMPQVSGTITSIYTDDTQYVQQGQTVIQLDNSDMLITLERMKAELAQAVRSVTELYNNVLQAEETVFLRHADLEKTTLDLKRREGLVGEKAISREEMQHYLTSFEAAEAEYNYAKAKYNSALALVVNTSLYQHPKVLRAEVNLKNAYLNFQRTTILAPVSGYVAKRVAQVGQQVNPGTALMAIVPLNEVWVDANYKETQLMRLRIGQPVDVTVDAYNGLAFHGRIHGFSPGTGSAFDLLPPQNATGNWIKIVQRLPVKIDLDQKELKDHPLHIGLSVRVTTNTHKLNGEILDKTVNDKAVYTTDVYSRQLADVNVMIQQIVEANALDMSLANKQFMTY